MYGCVNYIPRASLRVVHGSCCCQLILSSGRSQTATQHNGLQHSTTCCQVILSNGSLSDQAAARVLLAKALLAQLGAQGHRAMRPHDRVMHTVVSAAPVRASVCMRVCGPGGLACSMRVKTMQRATCNAHH